MSAISARSLRGLALRPLLAVVAGLLILLLPVAIPAANADGPDEGVRRIAKQLRCPICESVSVADSPADLAIQMRALIRRKLEAGESDQQILDYFVAAYGDSVLLEPPRRGLGWVVWLGPIVAVAAGALVLALVLRVWVRDRAPRLPESFAVQTALGQFDPSPATADLTAQASQELEAVRQGRRA